MSAVIRCENIRSEIMSPTVDGGYVEHEYNGFAWKCSGCGRVWEKRWHAESCERRKHVDSFKQEYFAGGAVVNGVPTGRRSVYTRSCIRREPIES